MTGDRYQELAARTINKALKDKDVELHALYGMAGEVGELQGLYQKAYQGHGFDDNHALKEVGDLLWFIAEYCTIKGWSLSDIMMINIEKLKKRFPDGFEVEKSLHRQEGDI